MTQPSKILVVDDNPVVMLNVVELLQSAGYQTSQAATGQECLRLAREHRPDLVLLDVVLPDLSGVELCQQMKADPDLRTLFVVLLSSVRTSSGSQATGLESGADGYIARPIENRELLARVQAMLRIQRAEAALREARSALERRVQADTAELARTNAALRALSLRLVEVQERERRFLARELHDEVGQMLTGAKLVLHLAAREAPERLRPRLAEAEGLLSELMEQVRQMSLDLRPQMLDDFGLLTALDWHLQRFSKQTNIQVTFDHALLARRLSPQLETALFRIVQEALTNVARYAGVAKATVKFEADDARVRMEVEDHGAGFDVQRALAARTSNGLAGMRERAELLGGRFALESAPGRGTRIQVELPVTGTTDSSVSGPKEEA